MIYAHVSVGVEHARQRRRRTLWHILEAERRGGNGGEWREFQGWSCNGVNVYLIRRCVPASFKANIVRVRLRERPWDTKGADNGKVEPV